jgi:hypothetical protein
MPPLPLADDNYKDKLGLKRNNPPGDAETSNNNWVDGGSASPALTMLSKADEESSASADGNEDDGASPTALGRTANGSNATNASTTALNLPVDGSDAPPVSTTTLGMPVGGSNATREGESAAPGAIGEDETPVGNGATGDSSIPPMQQSTLYPFFLQGSERVERPLAIAALVQNGMTVLTKVDNGSGMTLLVGHPLAARNAWALNGATAVAGLGRQLASAVGETRRAPRVSPPLAAMAVLQVKTKQAGKNVEGVAVHALGTLPVWGTTEGVAVRALGPLPSRTVVETVEVAADMVARPGTAVCTDGCAGGICVDGHTQTFVPAAIIVATAPAVANPYLNSAHGTVADTSRGFRGAVGGGDVCAHAPADTAGTTAEGDTPPTGSNMQGVHRHFEPHAFMEEELHGADLQLQRLTTADWRLLRIFGNTIHLNNGTHLDGGIGVTKDAKWQWLYHRVASCSLPLYNLPNGQWALCFLTTLTNLWVGVIQHCWNSERPLVFQAVILCRVRKISQFHDVKSIIWGWLDAWDAGRYVALVKEVEEANLDSGGGGRRVDVQHQDNATSLARRYNAMVHGGKVHAAVWMVTNRGAGGPHCPHNLDSKSGRPVIDVLWDKHPDCRVPLEEDFNAYPNAVNLLDTMPVYCFEKCIAKAAARLSGSTGPCGVKAKMLKHWLLRHGAHSEKLQEAIATWVNWLSEGSPPYAAYRAVNTVQPVTLEKCPGVRSLRVGQVWMRLWSDCSHMKTKVAATTACGNTQL